MSLRGQVSIWDDTFVAEVAISDRQVVKRGTDTTKARPTAGDNEPGLLGLSGQSQDAGLLCNVARMGKKEAIAGGNITAGNAVVSADNGRIKNVADLSLTDGDVVNVLGEAETGGVAGDVVDVKLNVYSYTYKS